MDDSKHKSKMMIKRFSDLGDSWSIRPSKEGITNGTEVDTELAHKIIDILNDYGYDISIRGQSDFLTNKTGLFGSETNLIEYRAEIVEKMSLSDFEDDYRLEHDLEQTGDLDEETMDKMKEAYEELEYDEVYNGNLTYSFFIGKNIKRHIIKEAAVYYGYLYMKMLHDMDESIVQKGTMIENMLDENIDGFKSFLDDSGIRITNKNVERVTEVNYRIYQDSKFFSEAHSECKEYSTIINQILKL
jgi:hypothetical protein